MYSEKQQQQRGNAIDLSQCVYSPALFVCRLSQLTTCYSHISDHAKSYKVSPLKGQLHPVCIFARISIPFSLGLQKYFNRADMVSFAGGVYHLLVRVEFAPVDMPASHNCRRVL